MLNQWLGGLVRLFGGTDKGSGYYFSNWLFWTKMALFLAILLHEIRPMLAFIGWRRALFAGRMPETSRARLRVRCGEISRACSIRSATASA